MDTLTKLMSAFRRKRPVLLNRGVLFLDDNAIAGHRFLPKWFLEIDFTFLVFLCSVDMSGIEKDTLANLYDWLDTIPFSRQKKNLARDFSDAVLAAELVKYFFSGMVDLHNYPSTYSMEQKKVNWSTFNNKVLKKLDFPLSDMTIAELASAKREATEYFLNTLRGKIDDHLKNKPQQPKRKKDLHRHEGPSVCRVHDKLIDELGSVVDLEIAAKKVNEDIKDTTKNMEQKVGVEVGKKMWSLRDSDLDTVPREVYEQKVQELLERDETIQVLKARIQRLEYMLHLKEITIARQQQLLDKSKPVQNYTDKTQTKKLIQR
ncbi:Sperm flagellar protein 1 [Araneus ventricosus]|uniref:Sperm flagellar protein 1 n=1 Tax=Araneus ventricosus TaxID=182803 RepID=A0A4Y2DVV2_ARAVE|nr:Sperm flagellar protein 1 [Araneus ventricosus]